VPTGAAVPYLDRALAAKDFAALDNAVKAINPASAGTAVAVIRTRLKDPDQRVRRLAAYALSQIDPKEARQAVPALVEALRDNEPRVRARVALALGQMGPAAHEAISPLGELLKDPDPRARAGAARALGSIGVEAQATIPMLVQLLKDTEPPVRGVTAIALGLMGPAARGAAPALSAVEAADPDAGVRAAAASALEAIEPPFPVLVDALTAPDANRRLWAVSVLTEKGPQAKAAVPNLIAVLKQDETVIVRAGAAYALGKMGAEARSACPVLITALTDPAARVRTAAALALGLIGPEAHGAGPALAAALKDEEREVAESAATALGNLGQEAETAVPLLTAAAKQKNLVLRRRAVNVLARIGPAARPATPVLLEAFSDRDPVLRREAGWALVSLGPQASASVDALIEALRWTDKEVDRNIRAWACLTLGQIGPPAAAAVPPLLTALQDDDRNVRAAAGFALGRIGLPAVPPLVKALDHVDARVRAGAAHALGGIGPGARRALSALREAARDEDPEVCLAAAEALGRIAGSLQLAQDTHALAALEETLKALEGVDSGRLAKEQQAEWTTSVDHVRQAILALHTVQRAQFFDRIFHSPWFPWLAGALLYAAVLLSFWSVLLWLRPLLLLRVNDSLRPLPHVRLPGLSGGMEMSLRGLLLVGFFHYHRRVLDAWIARHTQRFREHYQAKRTVKDRTVYVPVPVVLDGQVLPGLTARQLGQAFGRKRTCLLIWGEGGSGKTTLACQLGRWALADDRSERLCPHLMLPVLIEHELDLKTAEGQPAFAALTQAVRGQLQALIGEASPLPEELLDHLLRRRRILVIVDHLSEVATAAREAVRPGHAEFPAHALVVTSRSEEVLDGVPKSVVQPLRIEGNRLSSFMEAYLVQRDKRQLFDDAEYFEACRRLSLLAGAREITVLLAKLYAEQMIARKESWPQGSLPTNLPDLILGYLNELNGAVAKDQRRGDFEVQRDAEALAWECLRHSLRPESAGLDAAAEALGGDQAPRRLEYLEEQLKIIRTAEPARDRVSFTLDPLAEYLAALHLVNKNRADVGFWRGFAAQAAAAQAESQAIKGFLLAVRECCLVRKAPAAVVELLDEQLARAA
jgi:HEAT repeat protein